MTNDDDAERREGSKRSREPTTRGETTRRRLLAGGAATLATSGLAGCVDGVPFGSGAGGDTGTADEDGDADDVLPDLPRVEDPPDAVYVPTHREAMEHLPDAASGRVRGDADDHLSASVLARHRSTSRGGAAGVVSRCPPDVHAVGPGDGVCAPGRRRRRDARARRRRRGRRPASPVAHDLAVDGVPLRR